MNIHGDRILLRAIEESDLPQLHQWANDPEVWHLLDGWHFPSSSAFMREWFAGLNADHRHQRFAIEVQDIGLTGTANLVQIDWKNRNAFHGIMIGDVRHRRQGYGSDTIRTIMRYAFEELNLHRLETAIIEYNHPSLHTYIDKLGWKKEGLSRQWYFRNNRYWDRILLGITRDDYRSQKDSNRTTDTPHTEG